MTTNTGPKARSSKGTPNGPEPRQRPTRANASQLFAAAGGAFALAGHAGAQVAGERVVAGSASFARSGNVTTITASNNSIINYSSFNIRQGEAVRFVQPDNLSRVLNRINTALPTRIDGELSANGRVYIVNPAGVYFGRGAMINVGGIFAAAAHVNDADFVRGIDRFRTSAGGKVVNEGTIQAEVVGLIGREVFNMGAINAPAGTVMMVSGDSVLIGEQGGRVFARVEAPPQAGPPAPQGTPTPPRQARFGGGDMFGAAVWSKGAVRAKNAHLESQRGQTRVEGSIDVSSTTGKGGEIRALGQTVAVVGANLDASGATGGGTILVGGNFQGHGPERNAERTLVDTDSKLVADAWTNGDGGKVIVWSDDRTVFHGSLKARGGPEGGDGGFAEISGKNILHANTNVDLTAPKGRTGVVLYDPANIEIRGSQSGALDGSDDPDASDSNIQGGATPGTVAFGDEGAAADDPFVIHESEIEGTDANIVLQARISITTTGDFAGDNVLVANNRSLTLQTQNLNADGSGQINLTGSSDGTALEFRTQGTGNISIQASVSGEANGSISVGKLRTDTGSITLNAGGPTDTITLTNSITTAGGAIAFNGGPVTLAANVVVTNGGGAGNISFAGAIDSLNATPRDLTLTAGTGALTLSGNLGDSFPVGTLSVVSASGGVTTQAIRASSVSISDGGDVDINGSVVANGGFSAAGTGTFDNTGATIATSNNPLTVTFGDAVTLGAALSSSGGAISVTGDTIASSSTITSGSGSISFLASEIDLGAANSVSGTGQLILRPGTVGQAVDIGAPSNGGGQLDLTVADIAALNEGFSTIIIGRGNGEHSIEVSNPVSFKDTVQLQAPAGAGSLTVSAALNNSASTNAAAITVNFAQAVVFNGAVASRNGLINITGDSFASTSTINSGTATTIISANNGVTLGGAVTSNGGFTASGTTFDNTGGTIATSNNPLTLTFSDAVELGAALTSSGGTITVTSSAGTLTVDAPVNAGAGDVALDAGFGSLLDINATVTAGAGFASVVSDTFDSSGGTINTTGTDVQITTTSGTTVGAINTAGGAITIDAGSGTLAVASTLAAGSGNITLTGAEINLAGGAGSVSGTGQASFLPATVGQGINIGSDTGTAVLDFDATDIAALTQGFSSITIGRADGEHAITVGGTSVFKDDVLIQAPNATGSITLNAGLNTSGSSNSAGVTLLAKTAVAINGSLASSNGGAVSVTGSSITTTGTIGGGAGAVTLTADEIDLGAAVSGTSTLTLQPLNQGQPIVVGGNVAGGGSLDVLDSDIAQLAEGFSRIIIGRFNSTGGVVIATTGASFLDSVELRTPSGGAVAINGPLSTTGSANAADVFVSSGAGATDGVGGSIATGALTLSGDGDFVLDSSTNSFSSAVGTVAGNITLRNSGAFSAGTGGTALVATGAGNDVSLTSDAGSITVGQVTAADDVTINAAASIVDDNNSATTISGDNVTLTALTNIGTTGGGGELETAVTSLTATATNGQIAISEADGLELTSLTADGGGQSITVTSATGDITLGALSAATGTITITANGLTATDGSILDDGVQVAGVDTTFLTANTIVLTSNHDLGAGTATDVIDAGLLDLNAPDVTLTALNSDINANFAGSAIVGVGAPLTATGNIKIVANNDITAGALQALLSITLISQNGSIFDDNNNSTLLSASNITLKALNGQVGVLPTAGLGFTEQMDLSYSTFLDATAGNTGIFARLYHAGSGARTNRLRTLAAGGAGAQVNIDADTATGTGVLTVRAEDVSATTLISISNARGAITDDGGATTTRLVAPTVTLSAQNAIGATGAGNEIDTTATTLNLASTTSGDIFVTDADGVTVASATTAAGSININAAGTLAATSIAATGGSVTLATTTGGMTLTSVTANGAGANVTATATAGDISVASITAAGDTVTLTATSGSILDPDDATTKIAASTVALIAGTSIGATGANGGIDTDAASISADAGGGDVFIKELDGVAFTTLSATGDATVTNGSSDITLGDGTVGGTLNVTSAGAILGTSGARQGAGDAQLTAAIKIGDNALALGTSFGTVTATANGGVIVLNELDAITLTSLTAVGGNVVVANNSGNITVQDITAAGDAVTLTATGSVLDDGANGTVITASSATLNGLGGSVGTSVANEQMDLTVSTVSATASNGGVFLHNTGALAVTTAVASASNDVQIINDSGDITLGAVAAPNALTVTSAGAILNDANGSNEVSASTATLTAAGAIGAAATPLDARFDSLTASTTDGEIAIHEANGVALTSIVAGGAGRNIAITSTTGSIDVTTVTAAGDTVALTATAGAITDPDDATTTITASTVALNAGTSIGATGANGGVDTDAATISAAAGGGSVFIKETDGVTFTTLSATGNATVTNGSGDITLGNGTVVGTLNVTSAGAILGTAGARQGASDAQLTAAARIGQEGVLALGTSFDSTTATANAGEIVLNELDTISLVSLTAVGGNVIVANNTGAITVQSVSAAGNAVSLTAASGSIFDPDSSATRITANSVTLNSTSGGVGLTGANNEIDTDTSILTATANTGSIFVSNVGSLNVASVTATGSAANQGNVNITAASGDMTVVAVSAEVSATLTATAGAIIDDGDTGAGATRIVVGTTLTLNAANAIGGANVAAMDTDAGSLTATATNGSIFIEELNAVQLNAISAGGAGNQFNLRATNITDDGVNTTRVVAESVSLSASAGSVGSATGNGNIDTQTDTLTASATGGSIVVTDVDALTVTSAVASGAGTNDVSITTTTGDLTIATVTADNTVTLTAAGSISDDTVQGTQVAGATVNLTAQNGSIGAAANGDIDTAADTMSAQSTGGSVFLNELNGVAFSTLSATGNATVTNGSSDITLGNGTVVGTLSVSSAGAIFGTAGARQAAGDAQLTAATRIGQEGVLALSSSFGTATATANAGEIVLNELDAITLTNLTAVGGNVVVANNSGNITVQDITAAGNAVTLNATAGSILDPGDGTTKITASSATLTAAGTIGQTGANNEVDTDITTLTATAAGNASGIFISELNGLTLASVQATGTTSDVRVSSTSGNILANSVSATGTAALTAANGAIEEAGTDAGVDITGPTVTLTATGAIGGLGPIETDADTLIASSTTSGSILINNTGAVVLASVSTASGGVSINSTDQITATSVTATGGNVALTTGSGNILVNAVSATGTATLTAAGGAIEESGSDGTVDIAGTTVDLTAAGAVGGLGAIETDAATLNASSTTAGNIIINNTGAGAVTLGTVATTAGNVTIASGGQMTANSVTANGGNVALTVGSGNLLVNAVSSPAGTVTLNAVSGAIEESGADGTPDLTGTAVNLTATGAIGGLGAIETTTAALNASSTTAGNIILNNTTAVVLGTVATTSGGVAITSNGQMTATSVVANGGNISLATGAGNLLADSVSATGTASLTAAGSILESVAGDAGVDVAATALTMNAGGTIGAPSASLDTSVNSLTATAAGDINVSEANAVTIGGLTSTTGAVTLQTNGDITVNGNMLATQLALRTQGAGGISFGPNVDVNANVIEFNTGNGFGGTAAAGRVNAGTNAPDIRSTNGSRVTTMTIQQGPDFVQTDLPASTQFNPNLPPLAYNLIAEDGGIVITDASLVNGTNLVLQSASVTLPDINVLSLTTSGGTASLAGVRATTGNITIGGPATITGGSMVADVGVINMQSTTAGATNIPLTFTADEIEFAGAVSGNAALTIQPFTAGLGVFVGGTIDPGSGLWISQAEVNNLQDGFSGITIGRADGSGLLRVIGPVAFADPIALQMPLGAAAVDALINSRLNTDNTDVTLTSPLVTFTTAGAVRTPGRFIQVNGAVSVANALSLDSTNAGTNTAGAPVRVTGAINSDGGADRTLTINSGTVGTTTLDSNAGATTPLNAVALTGASIDIHQVRTTGAQTYNGSTTLRDALSSTVGGAITVNGATTLADGTILLTTAGAAPTDLVLLNGAVDSEAASARALSINAGTSGSATLGGAAGGTRPLAAVSIQGANIAVQNITTIGAQAFTGATTLNGNLRSTGSGSIAVTGPTLLGAPAVTVQTSGAVADSVDFSGIIDGASALTVLAGSSTATFSGNVGATTPLTSLASTAATTSLKSVTTTGNQTYTGAASLGGNLASTAGGDISVTGATTLGASPISIQASGAGADVNMVGAVDGASDLTLSAAGTARLGAPAGATTPLASLTASGAALDLNAVSTSGAQSLTGATTLRGNLASTAGAITVNGPTTLAATTLSMTAPGNIVVNGTVDGDSELTMTSSAAGVALGTAAAPSTVGQTTALRKLTMQGAQLGVASVTTTGDQTYSGAISLFGDLNSGAGNMNLNGAVNLGKASSATTSGSTITFASTIDGAQDLAVNAGTGIVNFAGDLGNTTKLASVNTTGGTINIPAKVQTTGTQAFTGNLSLTQASTEFSATGGSITVAGNVNGANSLLTFNSGTSNDSTLTGDATVRQLAFQSPAKLGNSSAATSISTTDGATFASSTTLLGDSSVSASAGRLYFVGDVLSGGGTPRAFTVTSGITPGVNSDSNGIFSSIPIVFGGSVGGTGAERLSSLTLGSALGSIPTTSSVVLTSFPIDANGNVVLPANFVLPDVQISGESALLPTLKINADAFEMAANQKLTAFGNLAIDVGSGDATLGDITALGDISVTAGRIFLRPRLGSSVTTNQFIGSPPQPGSVQDDGLDFIARDSITFSVAPEFTATGNARFATNTGTGLAIGTGGVLNNLLIQGVVFQGGVSNKLLTPRTNLGTALAGFENTGIPLDLSSNSQNVSNIASALASAVPSAQGVAVDTGTITLGSNVRAALQEMGVFTKDPFDPSSGLVEVAFEGLSGSTPFDDFPEKAIKPGEPIPVTPNRLSAATVGSALGAYNVLVGPADAERPTRINGIRDSIGAAWNEYSDSLGGADPDPAAFVEYLRTAEGGEKVLEHLQHISDLLGALDQLALTEVEVRHPKTTVLNDVRPDSMTTQQLEAAAAVLPPRPVAPMTLPTDTPEGSQPAPTPTGETPSSETPAPENPAPEGTPPADGAPMEPGTEPAPEPTPEPAPDQPGEDQPQRPAVGAK